MEQPKKCTKCGVEKPLDAFYNRKASKDGKQPYCVLCHAERDAEYRKKHAAKIAERKSEYQKKHAAKIAERKSEYQKKHAVKLAEYNVEYRKKHAAKLAEYNVEYHKKHTAKIAERKSEYNKKHAVKIAERVAEYRKKHAVKIAERVAEYRRTPAGKHAESKNRIARTFLKKACRLAETYAEEIKEIYRLANDTADLTGYEIHVDHICPLRAKIFDPDFGVALPASGLHVPWNLNPVHYSANLKKHNRVTLSEILAP